MGSLKFLNRFSTDMPGARTPAGPLASHPTDAFVWASVTLTTSPPAWLLLTRLESLQSGADTPLAYRLLCLRFTSFVRLRPQIPFRRFRSARGARLDTGGWLALTRRGLSPRQKRQASLDALTLSISRARSASAACIC